MKSRVASKAQATKQTIAGALPPKTFIIDNGAYTLKAGYAPEAPRDADDDEALSACATIPNALAKTRANRVLVGPQLLTQRAADWNEVVFRRPVEKGFIVNWEAQKEIWDYAFFDEKTAWKQDITAVPSPAETTLILTEPPCGLQVLQRNADEVVMEEWGFGAYLRCIGQCGSRSTATLYIYIYVYATMNG